MENTKNIETLIAEIEKGNVILTPGQKEQLRKGMRKYMYNDVWDKIKAEFKTDFEQLNYTDIHNKQVVCSLPVQEAIGTIIKAKYKVDNVRRLSAENETQIKEDIKQILDIIKR